MSTNANHPKLVIKPVAIASGAQVPLTIGLPPPGEPCRFTGLKRGTYYQLIAQGAIESFVVRREGKKRGRRLVVYSTVLDYLRHLQAEQCGKEAAK